MGKSKTAKVESLTTGKKVSLKAGPKTLSATVMLSKVWYSTNVGIFIDIAISGTPYMRMLMAKYGVYAVEKAAMILYKTAEHGLFNPRLGANGIEAVEVCHDTASDGAPTNVRIAFTAKPHKAANVIASILAKMQFAPPSGDLATALLAGFPRDVENLQYVAQKFYEAFATHTSVALIGGKRTSVRADIPSKFEKKFDKVYSKPDYGKATAPKSDDEALAAMKAGVATFSISISSPAGAVLVSHALSHHGTLGMDGKSITLATAPEYIAYARRKAGKILTNENKMGALLAEYKKLSSKDPLSENNIAVEMAIGGIVNGLPISDMLDVLALKGIAPAAVIKAVVDAASALKERKPAKAKAKPKEKEKAKPSGKKVKKTKALADGTIVSEEVNEEDDQ